MVLVSNEWQNKSEDEQKSSAAVVATSTTGATAPITATTTTTTAVAITSTISPATATIVNTDTATTTTTETIAPDSTNYKPPTIAAAITTTTTGTGTAATAATASIITPITIKSAANDNNNAANNEQQKDKNSTTATATTKEEIVCNNNKINDNNDESKETSNAITSTANNLKEDDFIASVLNYSNIKIMAENTKETPLKEEQEAVATTNNATSETAAAAESNLISQTDENSGSVKDLNESNSSPNSNTNTLQPSVTVKTQSIQNAKTTQQQQQPSSQPPLSSTITPHDFGSALQLALNATATAPTTNIDNSTTAAAGSGSDYILQALAVNVAERKKRLSAAAAADSTQTKNDSNLLDASNNSATITSSLATVVPSSDTSNGQAKIVLICEGNSHPFQARTISLTPNVECMVGRLIAKSKAAENNAIFDCKVLSRKHAVIWYSPDGKFWVKDTKSSNGTFINDNKLGDEEAELHFGDIVKFGVDVVENSRKEVHGCIIACVKLYLPDGREAISIDSPAHRSPYSGEGRISYDDLHRLNLYIQETAQREKVLASKLCSIQNILDATRKNSALCWQSMITEDQLLHRIHSLEKKLSFMEKNVPENVLRNEVLKLLDDKNSYQHTAKEALRKVYQERCDAMQMLAKMESAYTQSDNECALLRDQIMNSKQTLQDVNTRLLHLETEYNEYRDEVARQQQEAKEREEQRIAELTEKLRERELECEELKKKISELLLKRADLLDDEEKILEKQAIEKLDAAIADMDLGEDDDDDDDDDDDEDEENNDVESENKRNGNAAAAGIRSEAKVEGDDIKTGKDTNDASLPSAEAKKQTNLSTTAPSTLTSIFGDNINGIESEDKPKDKSPKMSKYKKAKMLASLKQSKTSPPKRVKESTIMKWLQNSDLNKNEGSLDIFKAICNENEDEAADSSDEDNNDEDGYNMKFSDVKLDSDQHSLEFTEKCTNFTSKLRNVEQNLKQLEAEIENRTKPETNCSNDDKKGAKERKEKAARATKRKDVYDFDENSDDDEENDEEEGGASAEEDEFIISRNGKASTSASYKVLSKSNKKYQLLKASVNMLREAYNEIKDTVHEEESRQSQENANSSPPPLVKLQAQFQAHNNTTSPTVTNSRLLETPESSRASCDDIDLDTDSISEVESLSLNSPVNSSHSTIKLEVNTPAAANHLLEVQLKEYQQQVGKLNEKLQQTELEAHQTLEIMQVECDDVKHKMLSLNKVIEALKDDKKALEQVINENKHNTTKSENQTASNEATAPPPTSPDVYYEIIEPESKINDEEVEDVVENDLADINVSALEREEELITYKERLEEQQQRNIELRNEIAALKLRAGRSAAVVATTTDILLRRFLPYGFVVLAIIVYFISTYF